MYFMIDPDLLRLEKMMVLIPRFTPPGSGLLVRITEKAPKEESHGRLMRETMRYFRRLSIRCCIGFKRSGCCVFRAGQIIMERRRRAVFF